MKKIFVVFGMVALLSVTVQAANILTGWTFDNLAIGTNSSPAPSTGFGTAGAVGLGSSSNPDVQSLSGSSSGGANSWRVRGTGVGGIGWSTNTAIGSQGTQFAASTVGYYQIQVSFDIYATTDAEADLQVQYTTEGSIWHNATIVSAGTSAILATNTITTNDLVVGNYIILTNNGTAAWNNQVIVNLTGISGVDNDANFAIRIVNASTGTNCVTTTGAPYNNTSGDWTFDNVVVQGVSFDTVADWTFDNDYVAPSGKLIDTNNAPFPAISNNTATAACIGFGTPGNPLLSGTFTTGSSTNCADITLNGAPYSSTGPSGQAVWRLRGQLGNGWLSTQPIGSQGAEFDVSTVNYSNIMVSFDIYFTSQGEAKMCVLYTTNSWTTTNVANNLAYGANPTFIVTNSVASPFYSPNTVTGTYFYNNYGTLFFNDMVIDFTGVPGVDNNLNFAFRIVNAATGFDCVNALNQPYNNNSGNCRLDNVAVNGQFEGQYAPTITNSSTAAVDGPFTNTFAVSPAWTNAIKSVYVNGVLLTNNNGYTLTSSNIVFTPSKAAILQISGFDNIVIYATGFTSAKVTQFVATGAAKSLSFLQPAAPSASGGTLTINPAFIVTDQYGNGTTNPYASMVVTATVSNSPATWTLGGSTVQSIVNGSCTFTDLTATVIGSTAVTNAAITFTVTGYTNSANHTTTTNIYSTSFVIGAPPVPFTPGNLAVLQIDTLSNNTTLSIIELKPSAAGQTKPVNVVPISATGTKALRLSSAGSCGKLALSDDGTFLVFDAFQDGSSATPDETFNLSRAVGTLNYTNLFTSPVSYVSTSYGGSQARAACSPDNLDFLICDKGGLYVNSSLVYEQNNLSTRSFGGATWVQTAKVAFPATASLYQFANASNGGNSIDWGDPGDNGPVINETFTPPSDPLAQDFYMISTNGGSSYTILYVLDQGGGTSGSSGIIYKWFLGNDGVTWTNSGSWTNGDNGDTLFATTNGSGGVYLYYSDGSGGAGGNSLIRLTDASANGPLNIISSNAIYTASANASIEGITFVPLQNPYTTELTPPPILTAQAGATVSSQFTITNTPDDPAWRSAITGVTVNGSPLPAAAYNTNLAGKIVFDPSQSALLQSSGSKTIVISATGYSTNSITQNLVAGAAVKLVITTPLTGPAADGGRLAAQPAVAVQDQFGNLVTTATSNVLAQASAGTWTLGGTTTQTAVSGTATFTNLTAFSTNAINGVTISFTSSGLTGATSSPFNIPAPIYSTLRGVKSVGSNLSFSFTNATGLNFSVLATNNIAAPVSTWPVVGQAVESPAGSGNYQFTNSITTNRLFYILRIP